MSCHQLFVLPCLAQQAVPTLPQQLHSRRHLPGTRHARFLHLSSRTSLERTQELPTVPIFVTEKVHVGIERNRAIPTKWRTCSSCRCVDSSRHMVDCKCIFGEPIKEPRKHKYGIVSSRNHYRSMQHVQRMRRISTP